MAFALPPTNESTNEYSKKTPPFFILPGYLSISGVNYFCEVVALDSWETISMKRAKSNFSSTLFGRSGHAGIFSRISVSPRRIVEKDTSPNDKDVRLPEMSKARFASVGDGSLGVILKIG